MDLGNAELRLKPEDLRARGTDLAEMTRFHISSRGGEEKEMGHDPALRLPHVADRRVLRQNE